MSDVLWPVDAVDDTPDYTGAWLRQVDSVKLSGATALKPFGARIGVRPGVGSPCSIAGLNWTITPHSGVLDYKTNELAGAQGYTFDANKTAAINALPTGSNTRIDLLSITYDDPIEDASSLPVPRVVYTPGTAANPGLQPATPASTMLAAVIHATSSGATITWVAPWTVAAGGILPVRDSTEYPASPYVGQQIDSVALGGPLRWNGSAWKVLPLGFQNLARTLGGDIVGTGGQGNVNVPVIAGRRYRVTAYFEGTQVSAAGTVSVTVNSLNQAQQRKMLSVALGLNVGTFAHGSLDYLAATSQTEQFFMTIGSSAGAMRVLAGSGYVQVEDIGV